MVYVGVYGGFIYYLGDVVVKRWFKLRRLWSFTGVSSLRRCSEVRGGL